MTVIAVDQSPALSAVVFVVAVLYVSVTIESDSAVPVTVSGDVVIVSPLVGEPIVVTAVVTEPLDGISTVMLTVSDVVVLASDVAVSV